MRELVAELAAVLNECDQRAATEALAAAQGTEQELNAYLTSNELWGGAGSVADQAGGADRNSHRKKIEAALVKLGTAQMAAGIVNARTGSWVYAFKGWAERGI